MAAVTAALISFNWGIYVWAIGSGRALDAALGYYINPLFSVALGALLLGERPHDAQLVAIALAAVAVLVPTVAAGQVPVAALGLTFTWGFYVYFKKSLPVGPGQGFFLVLQLHIMSSFVVADGCGVLVLSSPSGPMPCEARGKGRRQKKLGDQGSQLGGAHAARGSVRVGGGLVLSSSGLPEAARR
jgi:drug/metabolite transporter (DMT)-like permease